jgi:hypothetical protein
MIFFLRENKEFDGMFGNNNYLKNMCQSGQVTTSKNSQQTIPLPPLRPPSSLP